MKPSPCTPKIVGMCLWLLRHHRSGCRCSASCGLARGCHHPRRPRLVKRKVNQSWARGSASIRRRQRRPQARYRRRLGRLVRPLRFHANKTACKQHKALCRHGVLYDLLQREESTDLRSTMVAALGNRFAVGCGSSRTCTKNCRRFVQRSFWTKRLASQTSALRLEKKLSWAAHLLEIGTRISHSDFHKHGAYILDNADLPGFSMSELHRLSQLILGHRGKLEKIENLNSKNPEFILQLLSLRLAAILCHARRDPDLKGISLKIC
jgi:hypothetical protein